MKKSKSNIYFSYSFGVDPTEVLIPRAASWFKSTQSQNENQGSFHLLSSRYLLFAIEASQTSQVLLLQHFKLNRDLILHIRVRA